MKKSILLILILVASISNAYCQSTNPPSPKTNYNKSLAEEMGADDYGMRKYVVAFLKAGPNRSDNKAEATKLQAAHMANIKRLAKEGKLAIAGPFLDNGELRGIYIFNVETIEEAKKLTETDPAIKAGTLVMELHPWYGSAALGLVNKYHDKISKVKM